MTTHTAIVAIVGPTDPSPVLAPTGIVAIHAPHKHQDSPVTIEPLRPTWRTTATSRGFVLPIIQATIIATSFVALLLLSTHSPQPRDLSVDLVNGSTTSEQEQAQLDTTDERSISLRTSTNLDDSLQRLRVNDTYAVVDLTGDAPTVHLAGANGPTVNNTIVRIIDLADLGGGDQFVTVDHLPLGPDDAAGLPIFYLVFGVVLASYLFAIGSVNVGIGLTPTAHWASAAVFAVIAAGVTTTIASVGTGTVTTRHLHVALILAAASFATSAASALCLRVSRAWGTVIATVVLITLGNASGGLLPGEFLPALVAPFRNLLPMGIALTGIRDATYFGGHDLARVIASLTIWALVSIALMRALAVRRNQTTPTQSAT